MEAGKYDEALATFAAMGDYSDSQVKIAECKEIIYDNAMTLVEAGELGKAAMIFGKLGEYKDAPEHTRNLWTQVAQRETINVSNHIYEAHTVGLKANGTVVAVGDNDDGKCNVSGWLDIVAISAGGDHTVGLKANGTVVAVGDNDDGQCNVSGWQDIVAISAGYYHTVGLKANGTVVAVGDNCDGKCNVSGWSNIKIPEKNTTGK